jgi:hypothetical protein
LASYGDYKRFLRSSASPQQISATGGRRDRWVARDSVAYYAVKSNDSFQSSGLEEVAVSPWGFSITRIGGHQPFLLKG